MTSSRAAILRLRDVAEEQQGRLRRPVQVVEDQDVGSVSEVAASQPATASNSR